MQKFPFTNEGFQYLQRELYQLADPLLEIHTNLISENFKYWLNENFILSEAQIEFMKLQSQKMIKFLASQTGIAISNRLPISLIKSAAKKEDQSLGSKLIRSESNFSTLHHGNGRVEIGGNLIIHIFYATENCFDFISNAYQKYNQQYLNQLF